MTHQDPEQVFEMQHAAARAGSAPDLHERRERLTRLEKLLQAHATALAEAISEDFGGRSQTETKLLEVLPALRGIRHARRHLARWMKDERRPVDLVFQPAKAWVRYEPLGVVGIIAPWNYPLLLCIAPLTDAIAAGNRVMIKPSDLTPAFTALLSLLIADAFEVDVVSVIAGDVEVAKSFAALPFDHLFFTGSAAVGRSILQAAAPNLTPVTLELGGKTPAIIADDYPLERAVRSIAFGKAVNAGQTCIAPDYLLVPRPKIDTFASLFLKRMQDAYPRLAEDADYSAIISERHAERLRDALAEARAAGCRILSHDSWQETSRRLAPTLVIEPSPESLLMREEIFGPILPVIGYDSVEQAIEIMRSRERPLALYIFSHDQALRARLLDRVTSGGVTINGTLLHIAQDHLPFGGIGSSGMGAYHGHEGFKRFSHMRSVYKVGQVNAFEWLGPPWRGLSRLALRLLGGIR